MIRLTTILPVPPSSTPQNPQAGILLMCVTMLIFAFQDTLSKHLAGTYNPYMVTTIRFWFMTLLALGWALTRIRTMDAGARAGGGAGGGVRQPGGLRHVLRTRQPVLQALRGVMLAVQICILMTSFVTLGLIGTHAIFAATPLIIAALSVPLLGERVGPVRWFAIGIGFLGVLIILKPGLGLFEPTGLLAVSAGLIFALYSLLTRKVSHQDGPVTSFIWMAMAGAVVLTPVGVWFWEPMSLRDGAIMALLCVVSGFGHFLLIRTYALAEASAVQPFSYLQLVFASVLAVIFLGESLSLHVVIGACIVVGAGLITILRSRH